MPDAPGLAPPVDELTAEDGFMRLYAAMEDDVDMTWPLSPKLPDLDSALAALEPLVDEPICKGAN
jgi:hypothetical protein